MDAIDFGGRHHADVVGAVPYDNVVSHRQSFRTSVA
jgi:hypothetical protein